jgi:hypothetical protein
MPIFARQSQKNVQSGGRQWEELACERLHALNRTISDSDHRVKRSLIGGPIYVSLVCDSPQSESEIA